MGSNVYLVVLSGKEVKMSSVGINIVANVIVSVDQLKVISLKIIVLLLQISNLVFTVPILVVNTRMVATLTG